MAFLGGAVAGMIAGVLFAPKPGAETRRAVKVYAKRTEEEVIEGAKEARAALDEAIERGRRFFADKQGDVETAVKAGKKTIKEKMEQCCS